MEKRNKEKSPTVFDSMVLSFINETDGVDFIEACMSRAYDPAYVRKVPLRYRIIALGFAKRCSLKELNDMLQSSGCAGLYSRSLWETSLIYAFHNGLSYNEWRDLVEICDIVSNEIEIRDEFFPEARVGIKDIRYYLEKNSALADQGLITQHLTRAIDRKLRDVAIGKGEFRDFLIQNIGSFSPVREKTRYYFCKYLYYYLLSCRNRYLDAAEGSGNMHAALDELAVFKGVTKIKRKQMDRRAAAEVLDDSSVSFGAVFDAFNYFYFGYVSLDWINVLLEYYGNIDSLSDDDRKELASYLRKSDPAKYKNMSDNDILDSKQNELTEHEAVLDEFYSADGNNKGYQTNRAGENVIRKYVKGSLDIDRITLISFLVFFGSKSDLPEEMKIDRSRLTEILEECGFAGLRREDDFDNFIINFIESDDPVDYLMNEVTDYAMDEENFYLYKTYLASRSANTDILSLIQ